jgi:hypothetical protein
MSRPSRPWRRFTCAGWLAVVVLGCWSSGARAQLVAIAVSGAVVYVGGTFTSLGGQPRNNIGALDALSGMVAPWNPDADLSVAPRGERHLLRARAGGGARRRPARRAHRLVTPRLPQGNQLARADRRRGRSLSIEPVATAMPELPQVTSS